MKFQSLCRDVRNLKLELTLEGMGNPIIFREQGIKPLLQFKRPERSFNRVIGEPMYSYWILNMNGILEFRQRRQQYKVEVNIRRNGKPVLKQETRAKNFTPVEKSWEYEPEWVVSISMRFLLRTLLGAQIYFRSQVELSRSTSYWRYVQNVGCGKYPPFYIYKIGLEQNRYIAATSRRKLINLHSPVFRI